MNLEVVRLQAPDDLVQVDGLSVFAFLGALLDLAEVQENLVANR